MNEILKEDVQQFAERFELWELLRGKTFLITGATGLIGSLMIKCLLELNRQKNLGIKIVAVVRDLKKAMSILGSAYTEVSTLMMELSEIGIRNNNPLADYVIHLASPTSSRYFVEHPVETLRTVIEGTTSILEYARLYRIEGLVMASSLEVYGTNETDDWIREDYQGYVNPTEVRSSYNMGKRAAECLCHAYAKEYDVPVKIARLTQTTGAGIAKDDNRVIAQFARLAAESKDIVLHTTGEAARPYCYTMDAISAILYVLLKGENGEAYNVANEDTYISVHEMAEFLKEHNNPAIKVCYEMDGDYGYAPVTKLRLSTQKLQSLGWISMYGLKEIMERLIISINKEGDNINYYV